MHWLCPIASLRWSKVCADCALFPGGQAAACLVPEWSQIPGQLPVNKSHFHLLAVMYEPFICLGFLDMHILFPGVISLQLKWNQYYTTNAFVWNIFNTRGITQIFFSWQLQMHFMKWNGCIWIQISLMFVQNGPIGSTLVTLVHVLAWHKPPSSLYHCQGWNR